MKIRPYTLLPILCLLTSAQALHAQLPGSVETDLGLTIAVGDTTATVSETAYLGPGNYQVDGDWDIYSKNVWISPAAVLVGSGSIRFFNPSAAGGDPGPTVIDGNNNSAFINLNLALYNADGLSLTDVTAPDGSGWTDSTGNASLTTGKDLLFAVSAGNVFLGNYDLVTTSAATLSGYQPDRFVVSNGSGHLVHQDYTGLFVYPLGIAAGDYTPASIDNTGTANTFHVLVQHDSTSAAVTAGANGIARIWNIFSSDAAASAIVHLQHNLATDQADYTDAACFVTQYGSAVPNNTGQAPSTTAWQSNDPAAGSGLGTLTTGAAISGASERSLTYTNFATTPTDPLAYFSKSSDVQHPLGTVILPPKLFIPNVITPNGDGKNDFFVITGLTQFPNASLIIVNRWGNEVYRSGSYHNNWGGSGLNTGTYYYVLKVTQATGGIATYKGWLEILR